MGTVCASCDGEKQALKEMNVKGIYTTEQIEAEIERVWVLYNPENEKQISKDLAITMVTDSVESLGKCGDGRKFNLEDFEECLQQIDRMGTQKIIKTTVRGILVKMMIPNNLRFSRRNSYKNRKSQ